MTLNAKRQRKHAKLAALPGVQSIRRPVTPGSAQRFDMYYVRTGPPSDHPLVVIPGGPGVASVQQYRGLRKRLAHLGVDVIMVEHRGVGLSRHGDEGADLPPEAITVDQVVDDIAAVLDAADLSSVDVYGTSYGSYLAAGMVFATPDGSGRWFWTRRYCPPMTSMPCGPRFAGCYSTVAHPTRVGWLPRFVTCSTVEC